MRWALGSWLGHDVPFITFFPAVVFAGWYAGLGAGLVATLLGGLLGDYFFAGSGRFTFFEPAGLLRVLIFVGAGAVISVLCEQLHRARAARASDEAEHARLLDERERAAADRADARERERAATQRLTASEQRFQDVADVAPVLVWMSGPDKLFTWFNKGWLEFTGRSMEQELGNGWAENVHPDDLGRCLETYTGAFDRREPFDMDYRMRRHDGDWRWMMDRGRPMRAPGGEFLGYVGACVDVTERRQAEEERQKLLESERAARNEAERASQVKDEFLGTISHELRTPLQAILGWARLLRGGRIVGDEVSHAADVIERNTAIQTQLIDDLLDTNRIMSGNIRLDVERVELPAVVESAIESARPAADAKEIEIRSLLNSHTGTVTGDPHRLQQVVRNLLSNAVKFTPKGGRVEVALERVDSTLEISVRDNGQGIRPDFLPHVFDPFRQQDSSTTRGHRGMGLGLPIVRHLVELHGGSVRAQSAGEGRGATFTVALPINAATRDEKRDTERRPASVGLEEGHAYEPVDLSGVRVLVVDDEPDARDLLRRALLDAGGDVQVASGVPEALDAVDAARPDVVVSDIGMPGEDGYSLIRRLRARPADSGGRTPAIALTAFARPEDRTRALRSGFQMHIAKPVDPAELIAAVASIARVTR